MGMGSWWHWLIVAVVVLLLFGGKGKLSNLMGDAAKGIRAFRDGLKNDSDQPNNDGPSDGTSSLPRTDREREREDLNR